MYMYKEIHMAKDTLLAFRVDEGEKQMFKEAAKQADMPLSFWVRRTLKYAVRRIKKEAIVNEPVIIETQNTV